MVLTWLYLIFTTYYLYCTPLQRTTFKPQYMHLILVFAIVVAALELFTLTYKYYYCYASIKCDSQKLVHHMFTICLICQCWERQKQQHFNLIFPSYQGLANCSFSFSVYWKQTLFAVHKYVSRNLFSRQVEIKTQS